MKELTKKMNAQLLKMSATGKLFRTELTGQSIWNLYLQSFENDPTFRDPESSEHNCNLCNNFIRRYGNIVAIDNDNTIMTLFDFSIDGEYSNTVKVLSQQIKKSTIIDVFFETFNELNSLNYEKCNKSNDTFRLGIDKNHKRYTKEEAEKFGVVKPNQVYTFDHFYLDIPKQFVSFDYKSVEQIMGEYRDAYSVFERGMREISLDTLTLVKDLINQGSLLNGDTHLYKIEQIIPLKKQYDDLSVDQRQNWCWVNSYQLPFAKFKNELIGVLCSEIEISQGEDLNVACKSWNKRVDPANYMKATAPITKFQIEQARSFVEQNDYIESFDRRYASLDDIKVSEIKHINVGDKTIKSVSIFDNVKSSTQHKRTKFDNIESVSIEKFMTDILPSCTSVEAYFDNKHQNNLVTLTTANNIDSKPIFKWSNNYSWTFNGNLAGKSMIKNSVKTKGGKVDGVLRFSIMWAENDPSDNSDLDAWCLQPNGNKIGFSSKVDHFTTGALDVDIQTPSSYKHTDIVENITWDKLNKMPNGQYSFWVHQYSNRGSKGFKAEIEFDGQIFNYEYNQPVNGNVKVANVTLNNGQFTIEHLLPETNASKTIYGLDTNQFHKVELISLSPNHWDNNCVGNKHYFFMLQNCKVDQSIRSFHVENLNDDLLQHRKVIEVLGATNMIPVSDNKQLSGLGFNATVKDELIVKLEGNFKRMLKITF